MPMDAFGRCDVDVTDAFNPAGWLQLITEDKVGTGLSLDGPAQLG
jgi:hypothetical protein